MGCPPTRTGWGSPSPREETAEEYLIHSRRYASCVHAGGFSCLLMLLGERAVVGKKVVLLRSHRCGISTTPCDNSFFYFQIFGRHKSFCGATDTSVMDFWWCLPFWFQSQGLFKDLVFIKTWHILYFCVMQLEVLCVFPFHSTLIHLSLELCTVL